MGDKSTDFLPQKQIIYSAFNSSDKKEVNQFPEILDVIETPSLPPNKLCLKLNAIVMLLRNLNIQNGLVNSTRIQVTYLEKM